MVDTKKAFADAALIDVFAALQPQPILAAYAYKVVGSNVELHPKN
jgi:hypothetical protein